LTTIDGEGIVMRNGQHLYQVLEKFLFRNLILAVDSSTPEPRSRNAVRAA